MANDDFIALVLDLIGMEDITEGFDLLLPSDHQSRGDRQMTS